mmetsp:Transcript_41023/g.53775  ORF Transcript_41023/g.53775 Transcript_41023/m.53775 type:complete len:90 (+) Transcript_41023:438-707(+)
MWLLFLLVLNADTFLVLARIEHIVGRAAKVERDLLIAESWRRREQVPQNLVAAVARCTSMAIKACKLVKMHGLLRVGQIVSLVLGGLLV